MLVLTRKSEQSVVIGGTIEVKILAIHGDQVSIGFSAPKEVSIYRQEVYEAIQKQNLQAVHHGDIKLQFLKDALNTHLSDGSNDNLKKKGVIQGKMTEYGNRAESDSGWWADKAE